MTMQALVMLLVWPAVVVVLFGRLPRPEAAVWSILGGYLILPPAVELTIPGIQHVDKYVIPALFAFIMTLIRGRSASEAPPAPPFPPVVLAFFAMILIAPLLTAVTNTDTLVEGITVRPAITIIQAVGESILAAFHLLPFLLGYWLLSDPKGPQVLGRALILGMLAYSIPMAIEVRLSPQMNVWVYGYFQHDFIQTMRYGSFRPIVFLSHPLWVAFLTLSALICAIGFAFARGDRKSWMTVAYLTGLLLLCKTLGVLVHLMIAAPLLWLLTPRRMVMLSCLLGLGVTFYPALRAAPWMPIEELSEFISGAEADRGQSFEFRLNNEAILLQRAMERPLFGWGSWGRALLVDPDNGRILTVTDGEWIRILGERGILGYVAEFGLLLLPLFMLWRAWPPDDGRRRGPDQMLLAAMSIILGLNLMDLLPNATVTPLTWLMAGTIAGSAARMAANVYHGNENPVLAQALPKKTGLNTVL